MKGKQKEVGGLVGAGMKRPESDREWQAQGAGDRMQEREDTGGYMLGFAGGFCNKTCPKLGRKRVMGNEHWSGGHRRGLCLNRGPQARLVSNEQNLVSALES